MKKFFKDRKVLGSVCIVLALILSFVVAPAFSNIKSKQTEIVRVKSQIEENTLITKDMVETVKVGGYNLPSNTVTDPSTVIGKYALATLMPGDSILDTKIAAESPNAYLSQLDGKQVAVSISIKSFASGMSGKLRAGDIISLSVADYGDLKQTLMPEELRYVRLIAATNNTGVDRSADQKDTSSDDMPSTLTVIVTPKQELKLVEYENQGKLHAALVYRGSEANAQKFLELQSEYLNGGTVSNAG
ncbi:Flp pilus assembly protein CpaB [Faecalispora sporosphaeroides]|uniref:Flp pilus assembly protein CpaB n=1 Tax=Faecalispora sporosphaeroides TaxID=1549 RepID=UPI00037BBF79|nr:Flp pilus assembly protein CpaB [Faecalispora sporosphaeroides]